MFNARQIRDQFRSHLGDEQYAKFVTQLPSSNHGGHLRFWQEQAWDAFVKRNPDCQLNYAQIVDTFSECPFYGARILKLKYHERVATWLRGRPKILKTIEANNLVSDDRLGPVPVVFGFQNEEWLRLKSQMLTGDILQEFKSPPDTWERLAGRQGFALVRDGKVIDTIVTMLN